MKQGRGCSLTKWNLICSHAFVTHLFCSPNPCPLLITTSDSLPSTQILNIPDCSGLGRGASDACKRRICNCRIGNGNAAEEDEKEEEEEEEEGGVNAAS
jgi:hypothetical protein